MIDLRGLHLGNIARSPAESIRPDLWPTAGAWAPVLGPQMHDLTASNGLAVLSGGATYTPLGLDCLSTSTKAIATANLRYQIGNGSIGFPTTWVFQFSTYGITSNLEFVAVRREMSSSTGWQAYKTPENSFAFAIFDKSQTANITVQSNNALISPAAPHIFAVTYDGGSSAIGQDVYFNGEIVSNVSRTMSGVFIAPEPTSTGVVFGGWENTTFPFGGVIHTGYIYGRVLTPQQIADVSADPLIPFRRRQPVFYSVPSGSGSVVEVPAAMMMGL